MDLGPLGRIKLLVLEQVQNKLKNYLFDYFLLQSGEKKKDDETVDSLGMNSFLLLFGLKLGSHTQMPIGARQVI